MTDDIVERLSKCGHVHCAEAQAEIDRLRELVDGYKSTCAIQATALGKIAATERRKAVKECVALVEAQMFDTCDNDFELGKRAGLNLAIQMMEAGDEA